MSSNSRNSARSGPPPGQPPPISIPYVTPRTCVARPDIGATRVPRRRVRPRPANTTKSAFARPRRECARARRRPPASASAAASAGGGVGIPARGRADGPEGGERRRSEFRASRSPRQSRSIRRGWPMRMARIAISRGGSRGLRAPSRGGGNGAPAMPKRGPGSKPRRRAGRAAARARARWGPRGGAGAEKRREPLRHVGGVMFAQRFVGDRGGQFAQAPLEAGALFRRVESLALGLAQEQHFRERLGAGDHLARSPRRRRSARGRRDPGPPATARSAGSCPARSAAAPSRSRETRPCGPPRRRRSRGSAPAAIVHSSAH